jgi:hypothetical protein
LLFEFMKLPNEELQLRPGVAEQFCAEALTHPDPLGETEIHIPGSFQSARIASDDLDRTEPVEKSGGTGLPPRTAQEAEVVGCRSSMLAKNNG